MTTETKPLFRSAIEHSQKRTAIHKFSLLILAAVCACVLFVNLDAYPRLWFDEGYKLNAAYTVALDGLYATYTVNGYVPFDPGTTSGPADILPTALALKLLGTSIYVARLTSVFYTILAAVFMYQVARYLWGERAALFCVLLVIAAPPIENVGFVIMGRQSLSESATFSLILLGIWILSKAWRDYSLRWSIISGVVMGLAILSKSQVAISLVPALLTVAAWRWLRERRGFAHLFAPAVMVGVVFLGWMLLGQLLTPPDIRAQNSILLLDAIRTHLFTDLFGRNLNTKGLFVVFIMCFGILTSALRMRRTPHFSPQQWIEIVLVFFCVYLSVWLVVFSIGWTRYAYPGLVVSLLLIGRFIWHFLSRFQNRKLFEPLIFSVLILMALGVNLLQSVFLAVSPDVQNTAAYIATSIPTNAIIETWEWELDMLSHHRQYHHPSQALLFEAIRQNTHHQSFDLSYDPFQANPDYIIVGSFGLWTNIYPLSVITKEFILVANFGDYYVYKRRTAAS